MQAVLERALEAYRRQRFLEQVNAAYAELRSDASARAGLEADVGPWDRALADGLPSEGASPGRSRRRSVRGAAKRR